MTRRVLAFIIAASLMAAGGPAAHAQRLGDVRSSQPSELVAALFDPITNELNLTQEQQTQIESIATEELSRIDTLLQRLNKVTAALDEEQLKNDFDEDKVRALAAQGGQVIAEVAVVKLRVKARIIALLKPEQKALVTQQLRLNLAGGQRMFLQ